MELDLFGEEVKPDHPKQKIIIVKEEAAKPLPDNPPTLPINFKEREVDYITREPIPGGVRTTIWNKS